VVSAAASLSRQPFDALARSSSISGAKAGNRRIARGRVGSLFASGVLVESVMAMARIRA